MDIDGDGRSDRELVRNIIKLNGGIIDAELLDDGTRLPGKMSVNTRYLVSGLKPTDRAAPVDAERSGNYQKEYNRLMEEKTQFGVDEISIREMLDQMGWRAEERKVEIGSRGDGSSFRRRSPGATERPAAAAPAAESAAPPAADADAEAPAMEEEAAPAAEPAPASGADPFGD